MGEADMADEVDSREDEADTEATGAGLEVIVEATEGGAAMAVEAAMGVVGAGIEVIEEDTAVKGVDTATAEDDTGLARRYADRTIEVSDVEAPATVLEVDLRRGQGRGRGAGRTAVRDLGRGRTRAASARRRGGSGRSREVSAARGACRGASAEAGVRSGGGATLGPLVEARRSRTGEGRIEDVIGRCQ